jgi:hypothetical protein
MLTNARVVRICHQRAGIERPRGAHCAPGPHLGETQA